MVVFYNVTHKVSYIFHIPSSSRFSIQDNTVMR